MHGDGSYGAQKQDTQHTVAERRRQTRQTRLQTFQGKHTLGLTDVQTVRRQMSRRQRWGDLFSRSTVDTLLRETPSSDFISMSQAPRFFVKLDQQRKRLKVLSHQRSRHCCGEQRRSPISGVTHQFPVSDSCIEGFGKSCRLLQFNQPQNCAKFKYIEKKNGLNFFFFFLRENTKSLKQEIRKIGFLDVLSFERNVQRTNCTLAKFQKYLKYYFVQNATKMKLLGGTKLQVPLLVTEAPILILDTKHKNLNN